MLLNVQMSLSTVSNKIMLTIALVEINYMYRLITNRIRGNIYMYIPTYRTESNGNFSPNKKFFLVLETSIPNATLNWSVVFIYVMYFSNIKNVMKRIRVQLQSCRFDPGIAWYNKH